MSYTVGGNMLVQIPHQSAYTPCNVSSGEPRPKWTNQVLYISLVSSAEAHMQWQQGLFSIGLFNLWGLAESQQLRGRASSVCWAIVTAWGHSIRKDYIITKLRNLLNHASAQ